MKPTMSDIAKACGVSKTLVSRIVNKDKYLKIPDSTRNKVFAEIQRQNYTPNYNARNLKREEPNAKSGKCTIGYLTFSPEGSSGHPYFMHIFDGIIDEAIKNNCIITPAIIQPSGSNPDQWSFSHPEKMDGLILPCSIKVNSLKKVIEQHADKILSMDGFFNAKCDIVETEILKSQTMMLEHLLSLGYDDFGFLTGDIVERIDNCVAFLRLKGIEPNKDFILNCNHSTEKAYTKMCEILKTKKPPRVIMAFNDEMAIGCMKALIEAGYRIPDDVAIAGHDDIDMAPYTQVPLTTVRIYKEELGRMAVNVLLERIRTGRKVPVHVTMPGKIIVRKSCGAKK